MQNALLLAIPLFLSMIALEAIVGRRRGHRVYDFNETITNLSCGLGQQVVDIAFKLLVRYVFGVCFAVVLLLSSEHLTTTQLLVGGGFLLYSLVTVAMILEGARGATAREMLRIVAFVVALWLMPDPDLPSWRWLETSIHGVSLFSLACIVYYRWVLYPRSNPAKIST